MTTLWTRRENSGPQLERFLAADDHILDQELVAYDCMASLAHARMLLGIGVLDGEEFVQLETALAEIRDLAEQDEFIIGPSDEDCHTAIENHLTETCGEAGRKIHTGRSRNDQVLTALRLWEKDKISELEEGLGEFMAALENVCSKSGSIQLPGYTHMQAAMPTTVSVWLGSFADGVKDDLELLSTVGKIVDQCPLGTAAGFGVPVLELDREQTAQELGFGKVQTNPLYAQLSRGKFEGMVLGLCSQIMLGLNRLASDLILYSTREFGYVTLPARVTTGSSIMPQKRNPDVLELIRARLHVVMGEEHKVKTMTASLISGYNRDVQLTKGPLFAGVGTTLDCLQAMQEVLDGLEIQETVCTRGLTDEVFATERAMQLVAGGMPFRDAYRLIADQEAEKK
jgi:argininosuccinate lyase